MKSSLSTSMTAMNSPNKNGAGSDVRDRNVAPAVSKPRNKGGNDPKNVFFEAPNGNNRYGRGQAGDVLSTTMNGPVRSSNGVRESELGNEQD